MNSRLFKSAAIAVTTIGLVAGSMVAAQAAGDVQASAVQTFTVTNTDNLGAGSLRQAITDANGIGGGDTAVIDFTVSGTITLATALPAVAVPTTIDAGTAIPTTGAPDPDVTIDFNGNAGLSFASGAAGSELLGFALVGATGHGVEVSDDDITINNNLIGITTGGTADGNSGHGIFVGPGISGTLIGLNTANKSGVVGNVISGNAGDGINLTGASDSTIAANRIGTNLTGSAAVPNAGSGIQLQTASHDNMIGGTVFTDSGTGKTNNPTGSEGSVTPVFIVPPLGNQISGNDEYGININTSSVDNQLSGNFIGTRADGNAPVPNQLDGVIINDSNRNILSGCKFVNNPFVYYNVLAGNGQNGLNVVNSDDIVVQANFFGTGANNTTRVANGRNGMRFAGNSRDIQVGGVIPLGNVSAGNGWSGIEVRDTVTNFITFNTFGGLLAFKGPMPNGLNGLTVSSTGGRNLARTNVFSGNTGHGIHITGNAKGMTVDPNIVGLTTNGKTPMPNGKNGILVDGTAHGNVIGGTNRSVIPQNLFSGNRGFGVALLGRSHHNTIVDTFIGTTVFGTGRAPNRLGGLVIGSQSRRNVIGRFYTRGDISRASYSNIISGNIGNGLTIRRGSVGNVVKKNFVGVGRLGFAMKNSRAQIVNLGRGTRLVGNTTTPLR